MGTATTRTAGTPAVRTDIADVDFAVRDVGPLEHAAVPTLVFRLTLTRTGGGPVRSVSLNTTVRIDVARRRYDGAQPAALARLFGQPEQWATSMRPLTWARLTTVVPPFEDTTEVDLALPCGQEYELAVAGYFEAVRDGEIPLDLLFSGTVFHSGEDGRLRTSQICWSKDAPCAVPAKLWHALVARYHGGSTWVRLPREAYDALSAYRSRHGLESWERTVFALLGDGPGRVHPTDVGEERRTR
jgi:uncharacterized protein DUF6084